MKYRSRTEIIAMILEAAANGATKTMLMYHAYLSHSQIQEYIQFLTERNLIALEKGAKQYKLTPSGIHFLHVYSEIKDILSLNESDKAPATAFAS